MKAHLFVLPAFLFVVSFFGVLNQPVLPSFGSPEGFAVVALNQLPPLFLWFLSPLFKSKPFQSKIFVETLITGFSLSAFLINGYWHYPFAGACTILIFLYLSKSFPYDQAILLSGFALFASDQLWQFPFYASFILQHGTLVFLSIVKDSALPLFAVPAFFHFLGGRVVKSLECKFILVVCIALELSQVQFVGFPHSNDVIYLLLFIPLMAFFGSSRVQ